LRSESCSNWTWILRKGQALGNRIVQLLGEQVALLGNRQFLLAGAQALVLDGHAEMLAEGFEQARSPAPTPGCVPEIEVEDTDRCGCMQNIESRRRGEAFTDAGAQFHAGRRVGRIEHRPACRFE
jgi:hypothetical protein